MQNNVTELTNRLLRALDNNYNVIDMPAVIEIVSLLEKVSITKELLETTRLGKHVNELRRKTDNDSLSKRAKELVKKWRNMVLPDSTNGQLKQPELALADSNKKRPLTKSPPIGQQDVKRVKLNGQTGSSELDMSDTSNSSFKDVINLNSTKLTRRDVILINSDSNSSFPEMKSEPLLEQQIPKKRGRKKGSKNHKNLLDEAETSFTNKLAVSRGNSKVKTTQELIAGLQNKNNTNSSSNSNLATSPVKSKEDLNVRAAKLTERVSIIDQKLNTNANRYKNSQRKSLQTKIHLGERSDRIIESGSVINDKSLMIKHEQQTDEEVIVVDDLEPTVPVKEELFGSFNEDSQQQQMIDEDVNKVRSLSVEEALAQLPPIDKTVLDDEVNSYRESICTCTLKESESERVVSGDEDDEESGVVKSDLVKKYEFVEDGECVARVSRKQYADESSLTPQDLHTKCLENINGNWGVGIGFGERSRPELVAKDGLYVNVVPNVNIEHLAKDVKCDFSCENYKKYNVSECDSGECGDEDGRRTARVINNCVEQEESVLLQQEEGEDAKKVFREWHEVLDKPSYNGEILKILPYVIID